MKVVASIFLLVCLSLFSEAQTEPRVVQVSGVAVIGDSLYPAPFISVYRQKDYRGTFTDMTGYFTLPAIEGDTLFFYGTGLKKSSFRVPTGNTDPRVSLIQLMEEDTIVLKTAYILPYPSPDKLRREILALDLPNDQYHKFSRDVVSVSRYDGMVDFNDQSMKNAQNTLGTRYSNGFQSGGNLLDAGAWSKFMKAMRRGELNER